MKNLFYKMNYQTFEVFGTQHLVTLFICAALILSYIKYFQNQTESKKVLGGKIVAIIIIIHMLTQPIYDCLLYTSPSPRDRQKSRMPSSA